MGPFMSYPPLKTPEQLNQEYSQMMQQYQNMYRNLAPSMTHNNYSNNVTSQSAVSTSGDYKIIEKYSEVENTPTRLDGTASLFFDFDNMVFWSKKFTNGQHAIQAYKFMPINSSENNTNTNSSPEPEQPKEAINVESVLKDVLERLSTIEKTISKTNRNTKNKPQGDLVDEPK